MKIDRITSLRKCGVFRDFAWPKNELEDFARFNLIYGWNGSGKTTLSRLFRALKTGAKPEGEAVVRIDGKDVKGAEFGQQDRPVRVFNREFREQNVFPVGGRVPHIYVLGEQSVEKQKMLETCKEGLDNKKEELERLEQEKTRCSKDLDRFCIDEAKKIKTDLLEFSQSYLNYDKRRFIARLDRMTCAGDWDNHIPNATEQGEILKSIKSGEKSLLEKIPDDFPDMLEHGRDIADLLGKTVVTETIRSLQTDEKLASWLREGLHLHRKRNAGECLFCEQTLPESRLEKLEKHFSKKYEELLQKITHKVEDLERDIKSLAGIRIPKAAELNDRLSPEFESAVSKFHAERDCVRSGLEDFIAALEQKRGCLFEQIPFEVKPPDLDTKSVDRSNQIIGEHNRICEDFAAHVKSSCERLEAGGVADCYEGYRRYEKDVKDAENKLVEAKKEVKSLEEEIRELEEEIIEHRRPAEELNADLHDYLGHDELRFEVRDTGYRIMRKDGPGESLSEGESTAIALLYFLKSLSDKDFNLKKGVVVLDDPVSSLDQNALFAAQVFIRERTGKAGQIFIFTHNFMFFRLVRYWFKHLRGDEKKQGGDEKKQARFYMLRCAQENDDSRVASLCKLDSLLEHYDTEYHYLFSRIYRLATNSKETDLEDYGCVPNMARRVLESFMAFRLPGRESVQKRMKDSEFEPYKCDRICRFVNEFSHLNFTGDADEPQSLYENREVLNDLLAFMKHVDEKHFNKMEEFCSSAA